MSLENTDLNAIEDIHADFDEFLSQKNWTEARVCIENVREISEHSAQLMMKSLYRAQNKHVEKMQKVAEIMERGNYFDEDKEQEDWRDIADRSGY